MGLSVAKDDQAVVCKQIQVLGYLLPKDLLIITFLGLPKERGHTSSNELISHLFIVMLLVTA